MIFVDWGDGDETFLVWKFDGDWNPGEVPQIMYQINEFASERDYPIDLIIDLQRASIHKGNVISMGYTIMSTLNSNIETIIAITRNPFWESIYATIRRVYHTKPLRTFNFVHHADDAYAIIESNRERREASCG